jgi:protocatechuate 4,5-dioxygenase alpha subunit
MTEGDDETPTVPDAPRAQAQYRIPHADYHELAGTYVYDGERARLGYALNRCFVSLRNQANRAAFVADPETYLERWPLTDAQRTAVLERRWIELFEQGMNIFAGAILGAIDGRNIQSIGSEMVGITEAEFHEMLRTSARPTGSKEAG